MALSTPPPPSETSNAAPRRPPPKVLVEEKSGGRIFMLNRPKQLNALSGLMVSCLLELFLACALDSSVKLIILKLFAMPETGLGLFPDIGASYFLSRLPGFFGEYVGLTGARLDGAEMLACGLATHFVQSERLPLLEEALVKADSSDPGVISTTIGEFSHAPNLKKNSACCRLDIINKCFSKRTVEEIIAALEREVADKKDDWISSTIQSLKKASPISLKVSLRSIREGRLQSIGKCLVREFRIVCHMMLGEVSKDFIEGCRAILLDKDKNPKWAPSKLESISDEMVDRYFSKDLHNLHRGSNVTSPIML